MRHLKRAVLVLGAIVVLYGGLLLRPQALFAYETRAGNVVLHARTPLPLRAAEIAAAARERVSRSPFYSPTDAPYNVFLCDSGALFDLFALWRYRASGFAQNELAGNVFLRPAHIEHDRLTGPSGNEAGGDRTLTYFIAHEITHAMIGRRVGRWAYARLPQWQNEGYADYVGKAGVFDFPAILRDFKAGSPNLDPRRSGLYLRYHLLVAHLLDHEGMTPQELLSRPRDAAPLEAALRRP
jgi:hypothetical protein